MNVIFYVKDNEDTRNEAYARLLNGEPIQELTYEMHSNQAHVGDNIYIYIGPRFNNIPHVYVNTICIHCILTHVENIPNDRKHQVVTLQFQEIFENPTRLATVNRTLQPNPHLNGHNVRYKRLSQNEVEALGWPPTKRIDYDIQEICNDPNLNITQRQQLINARIGQGEFRNELINEFGGTCSITNLNYPCLLIASHILPWANANNQQRLDHNNGLLLHPFIDKLFDKFYISFDCRTGEIIYCPGFPPPLRDILQGFCTALPQQYLTPERQVFLQTHNEQTRRTHFGE